MWRSIFILFFLLPDMGGGRRYNLSSRRVEDAVIDCGAYTEAGVCGAPAGMGAGFGVPAKDASGRFAPVFPGWGHYHYRVSTTSDSAQFYFDQGLSLYYSYHLPESAASFREAARRDSGCAMAYWGEALAMGPYYNIAYFYKMPPGVLPVLDEMNALASHANAKEKDLISALNARYSTDTTDSRRTELNGAYSAAMKRLIGIYSEDNDIKALYIDGMMTEHAWDMWDNEAKPKPWTPGLVKYCEEILASNPEHPAALHYHIHLLEASLHPEATLASADELKDLMPGVPHMVHMASHSYQRTGLFAKGVVINDSANAAQKRFSELAPQLRLSTDVIHYDAVQAYCAMNGAMYAKAMHSATKCLDITMAHGGVVNTNLQFLSSLPLFVLVRSGKWQAILDQPTPDSRWIYSSLLSDFARGMAYTHMGKTAPAQACLDSLRVLLKDPSLAVRHRPFNPVVKPATVAEKILEGELLFIGGKTDAAMNAFQSAIENEDGMDYLEPNEWPLPARQYAGAFLLRLGRSDEAEKLYQEDLVQNPGNGWALLGLAQSLEMQHKKGSGEYREKAKKAFAGADEMPDASVY
jgi:tetratricopeptide (TPR) repeat protein